MEEYDLRKYHIKQTIYGWAVMCAIFAGIASGALLINNLLDTAIHTVNTWYEVDQ